MQRGRMCGVGVWCSGTWWVPYSETEVVFNHVSRVIWSQLNTAEYINLVHARSKNKTVSTYSYNHTVSRSQVFLCCFGNNMYLQYSSLSFGILKKMQSCAQISWLMKAMLMRQAAWSIRYHVNVENPSHSCSALTQSDTHLRGLLLSNRYWITYFWCTGIKYAYLSSYCCVTLSWCYSWICNKCAVCDIWGVQEMRKH